MLYEYTNKSVAPDFDQVHIDVNNSSMTDKSLEWCRWDEEPAIIKIKFTNTLSIEDKTILDTIVSNNS